MITLRISAAGIIHWPPGVITASILPARIQLATVLVHTPARAAACPVFIGSPFISRNLAATVRVSISLGTLPAPFRHAPVRG